MFLFFISHIYYHNPYTSLYYKITLQIFSSTKMKFIVSFLIFLLTLVLVIMASLLSSSTTQLLAFHILFPIFYIFSLSTLTDIFSSDWKNSNIVWFLNWKPLLHPFQTIAQSLYFPYQLRFWNITSLIICTTFVPLITSFLIVSLVSDLDS